MPTIKEMRLALHEAYPKARLEWHEKVNRMPTNQVVAIYKSLQKRENKEAEEFHQYNIFEYMTTCTDEGSHTSIAI